MTSAEEYNKEWTLKLVKNKRKFPNNSWIDFFGEFEYDINPDTKSGDGMAKALALIAKLDGKEVPEDEPDEDKPKPIYLRSKRVWVEGTRDNFSMYLYDNNSESEDEEEKKYYFKAENYGSPGSGSSSFFKLLNGSEKSDSESPTFYSLRYKDNLPIIYCNDFKIPEKYFILSGRNFSHTKNINVALEQTKMNFYRFADDIARKKVKDYEDEQERIRLEKLRLEKEARERAKMIKYAIIGGSVLVLLVIVYFVFLRKSGKKKLRRRRPKKLPIYVKDE